MHLETPRLLLRHLHAGDAPFILRLLNEPGFIRFIGDRGVRDLDDARRYIAMGPAASYARHGFGLDLVARREDGVAVGICGLLQRDHLPDPDLGFALLKEFEGRGYAFEAASRTLDVADTGLARARVLAVTHPDNLRSLRLLERLGFQFERRVLWPGENEEVCLLVRKVPGA